MKIALGIEYNGSLYHGWQSQDKIISIQSYVENALSKIADESITVFCASRTDTGVHAFGQVIHFKTNAYRSKIAWIKGTNSYLPKDIAVQWVSLVNEDFHARFSAISRRYYYIIYNYKQRSALTNRSFMYFTKTLDIQKMIIASQYLLGEHDFTAFRAVRCQSHSPWRKIFFINIKRFDRFIIIDIKANSFVYRMIRNIIGSLIEVGNGNKSEDWISTLLLKRNRQLAGVTVPAKGLHLVEIDYPSYFNLPSPTIKLFFIE